ncbi:uncharacterized protein M421DRAFT_416136 [Didymella exigua CBS 183.55]|uniref:REJ domain-containing protein n=1 Tax=Didymella exigua CBS 183.55 TaxID=1150837 RepID=A0A6A5S2X1_9PLEO|nr:uncharacterized protein M421DRAFT_416136 [Didymella exigua CBS 183.55]KAF1933784.1 hypothetical protein M421DRAFT_416136 [Didymella exigua CBS 183.55]
MAAYKACVCVGVCVCVYLQAWSITKNSPSLSSSLGSSLDLSLSPSLGLSLSPSLDLSLSPSLGLSLSPSLGSSPSRRSRCEAHLASACLTGNHHVRSTS